MRFLPLLLLGLACLPPPAAAESAEAACGKAAADAYVKLPPMVLRCDDNGRLACSAEHPAAADQAACTAAGPAYARLLQRVLHPGWWAVPAEEMEACREQKEGASPDEGAGEAIQGSGRVRLLVLGNGCEGSGGVYNLVLAVRSDQGVTVKVLALDYYEPRQEAPFALAVVHNGADTLALFTRTTHDLHEAAAETTAYKVDLASGSIAEYPLYLTESGPHATLTSTEPTLNFDEDESSAQVRDGHLAERFVQYAYLKDCPEDGPCAAEDVVEKRRFGWNGSAFVVDRYEEMRRTYLRRLQAHRECLKSSFDARSGSASCPGDFDGNCESDNDLSYLNYKAGNLDLARRHAAKALEECRFDAKQLAAAQFNDRRARGQQAP